MTWLCTLLKIACTAGTISGSAYIQDGDTIYVANQPVRLAGIDAEELDEPHGLQAKAHLRQLIGDRIVTCRWDGWSYKRKVGTCFAGSIDLNAQMVRDGFALDCAHYSNGRYRSLEPAGIRSKLIQKPYC
jgi:micrococcal nuclease